MFPLEVHCTFSFHPSKRLPFENILHYAIKKKTLQAVSEKNAVNRDRKAL